MPDKSLPKHDQATIKSYLAEHTDPVPPLLERLIAETEETTGFSRWSIGRVEGQLLQLLVKISGAESVVEIGTFTGYSALLMAAALPPGGNLVTCEANAEYAALAQRYFNQSPHGKKIRLRLGPALETLAAMPAQSADFFFIDADKTSYGKYYEEAVRILHPGGLAVVDNVLWRFKIFKKQIANPNARAIAAFNEQVREDKRVEKVMLGVRDGIYLIRKK